MDMQSYCAAVLLICTAIVPPLLQCYDIEMLEICIAKDLKFYDAAVILCRRHILLKCYGPVKV